MSKSNILINKMISIFNRKYFFLIYLIIKGFFKKKGFVRYSGLTIEYNDSTSLIGMYNEIVFQECYKFIPETENPVIIDCGANIGISILYFSSEIPSASIYAFEADPNVFEILSRNIKKNNSNAILIQKAVWTSNDETLKFGGIGGDAGSLYATENIIEVKSIRLKDFIESFKEIEILKIDIEGAEIDVIKDCANSLAHINKVFIEYHSFTDKKQELDLLLNILTSSGFRYKILPARKEEKPFVRELKPKIMDLQLNLFFYRL